MDEENRITKLKNRLTDWIQSVKLPTVTLIIKVNVMNLKEEIHNAEICRALDLVASTWDQTEELDVDEMCLHMDSVGDIMNGTSNFAEFIKITNLAGQERLN